MRWAWTALSTVAVTTLLLIGLTPDGAGAARPAPVSAPLRLASQTPWVQASAPWFTLTMDVGAVTIPLDQLRVNATFYSRMGDASELQQSLSGTPDMGTLQHVTGVAVSSGPFGRTVSVCVTVLPDSGTTPPAAGTGACPPGSPTVVLNCTPGTGRCGDVYPVSVALLRQGSSTPLARFTTFLTYEEPAAVNGTGPLRVGWVVPVSNPSSNLVDTLADHKQVPVTLAVTPSQLAHLEQEGKTGGHQLDELAALGAPGGDEVLGQPYLPINLAALEQARLGGEITAQIERGAQILRPLHPTAGTWVDTVSTLTAANGPALIQGLAAAHVSTLVVNDTVLASSSANQKYTPAHPFSLSSSRGTRVTVLAANSVLDSRFSAEGNDPVLAANQLLASLSFVHFENAFLHDPRGIVLVPPGGWSPSGGFVDTMLVGLGTNPALRPVTLAQLTAQVQPGGDSGDPTTRRLQAGGAGTDGFTHPVIERIGQARAHLASLAAPGTGAIPSHLGIITTLSDQLLASEAQGASAARRSTVLSAYDRSFGRVLAQVSLATEKTITFTARTAPIPITVLSSAPYPFKVVMTVQSDKFTFGGGGTRTLVLDRPTTPVRVQASARTSGDRLPVEVSLRTPDGQLLIARTTLTVHSTSISIVGIALTVLALLVLLMWWARTWRRSRQHRPRAH